MTDLVWSITSVGILAIIVLIGILVVWRIVKDKKSGFPAADERTQRISGKAATYALLIGLYFTIALMFVNLASEVFYDSPAFEAGYALIATLLVYSLSWIGLRFYLDRKGDF